MSKLFSGKQLAKADGSLVDGEMALSGKLVALYFSAHWCPPCRRFTPILKNFYDELTRSEKFEIVFFSSDHSDEDLQKYLKEAHGDWLHVPFGNELIPSLKGKYAVRSIPTLLIVKDDGTVITKDGNVDVENRSPKQAFAIWKSKA